MQQNFQKKVEDAQIEQRLGEDTIRHQTDAQTKRQSVKMIANTTITRDMIMNRMGQIHEKTKQ